MKIYAALWLAATAAMLAPPVLAQEDCTSKIVNPSFEQNGLSGWDNSGLQSQTNDSPASVGWEKNGTTYAEKWVSTTSTCGTASISQTVKGLANGEYKLTIVGHSVNQSGEPETTSGTFVFAGKNRSAVSGFGEYVVTATVAEGYLKIGFGCENTDANWIAVDNFRLQRTGENLANYKAYLQEVIDEAEAIVNDPNRPAGSDVSAIQAALAKAKSAQTKDQVLAAISALRSAIDNYQSTMRNYRRLSSQINIAEDFYAGSDYDGKPLLRKAIDDAKKVYDSAASTAADLGAAVDALKAAQSAYLANRPEEWVTIKNGAMWKDSDGNSVQAHGAGFLQLNDTWYMIGEDRTGSPDVNMYSSKDLVHWKFERKIIQNKVTNPQLGNSRMIERPKLMYCDATGQFVVWCHWEAGNYSASEAGVFYADKVNDPYTFYSGSRPLGVKSRDCNVFVDDNGQAYFISTIEENTHLGLFKLSDDYLDATEYVELFKNQRREAPAIVKVNGKYYMLSSACSGWDPNQCRLSISESLQSGWSNLKNLGNTIAFDTQPASILTVKGTKATTYLFVGDRWQDPNLPESKTIIFPISFTENGCDYTYRDQFDINFATGEWRETPTETSGRLDKSQWQLLSVSSEETTKEDGAATNAFDNDYSTKWHSQWSGTVPANPNEIAIDLGKKYNLTAFVAAPRNDNSTSGIVREFGFLVSNDGENWTMVSGGEWMPYWAEVRFPSKEARYVKFSGLKGYTAVSEIDVIADQYAYDAIDSFKQAFKINDGRWTTGNEIEIEEGQSITFNTSVSGAWGSWALQGPDTIIAGREVVVENIKMSQAGTYRAFFLDRYNQSHSCEYNVKVGPAGIASAISAEIVNTEYFSLDGIKIDENRIGRGICIKRVTYSDGTVRASKVTR